MMVISACENQASASHEVHENVFTFFPFADVG